MRHFGHFLVIATLLWSASLAAQNYEAKNGVLDLRSVNLQDQSFQLKGTFNFKWKQLLSPEAFNPSTAAPIDFPIEWGGLIVGKDTLTAKGYGTYQLTILLPKSARDIELGLSVQDMYSSYRLFLDGKEVAVNGKVGTSKDEYKPYWLPQAIRFEATRDTLDFVLQVANFDHSKGGVREPIMFGDASEGGITI